MTKLIVTISLPSRANAAYINRICWLMDVFLVSFVLRLRCWLSYALMNKVIAADANQFVTLLHNHRFFVGTLAIAYAYLLSQENHWPNNNITYCHNCPYIRITRIANTQPMLLSPLSCSFTNKEPNQYTYPHWNIHTWAVRGRATEHLEFVLEREQMLPG